MKEICPKKLCTGCSACNAICPAHCIKMVENNEGFLYPSIDYAKCLNCNSCVRVCPANKIAKDSSPSFYYGWNKNTNEIMKSSSGGIFRALANYILSKGGVVIGVQLFPEKYYAKHIAVYKQRDLDQIKYSKYFQSDDCDAYFTVRELINKNIYVLFCGTACQIDGLNSFLGNSENKKFLYTVDVLCHGVNSKKVVKKYIESQEKKYKKKIVDYQFRVKEMNHYWKNGGGTSMKLFFDDGSSKIFSCVYDTYFVGFNEDLMLRESCYSCKYAGHDRCSDLTLADYWGVSDDLAPMDQYIYGISAFTINSPKGYELIDKIKDKIFYKATNSEKITNYNLAFKEPQKRPKERDYIYNLIESKDYNKIIHKVRLRYYIKHHIKDLTILILGEERYRKIMNKIKDTNKL